MNLLGKINLNNKNQLTFIVLLVVLSFFASKKIFRYHEKRISYLKSEISRIEQIKQTTQDIIISRTKIEPFRTLSWDTKEMVAIMGKINAIAGKHNIQIISFDPAGTSTIKDSYTVFNMNLDMRAEYFDLLRFIAEIENFQMLTKIAAFKIYPEDNNFQANSLLRGNLSIEAYAL